MRLKKASATLACVLAAGGGLAACGGGSDTSAVDPNAAEVSPPGDIPDNQAFVAYAPPGADFSVKVPEGWARTNDGDATTFTDKLNSIRIESQSAEGAPTVGSVKKELVPQLARDVEGFSPGDVSSVSRSAGNAILITYQADGKRDPVTGKSARNDVERYIFFDAGEEAILTLSGPEGADNVDPWMIVTDSLRWTR